MGTPTGTSAGPGADSASRAATAPRRSAAAGRSARGDVLPSRRPQPVGSGDPAASRIRRRGVARGRNRPLVADDRSFGRTVLTSGNHVRLSVIAALFALAASSQPKAITFRIPQPTLADHRWLSQKGVEPWRYGIAQEWLRKLGELWSTTYDWRRAEARINRFHNFIAEIDGKKLHYILEKGSGNAAVPLVLLHGWPYSFYSFIDVIEPLAHPERFGGDVKDAFDVIVISAPGVGLSEAPDVPENLRAVGRRYDKLLTEVLGYPQYIVHGGDQGAISAGWMAHDFSTHLMGHHVHMLYPDIPDEPADPSSAEVDFTKRVQSLRRDQRAYISTHIFRGETLAAALADNPVGQAAWMLDKWYWWTDRRLRSFSDIYSSERLID